MPKTYTAHATMPSGTARLMQVKAAIGTLVDFDSILGRRRQREDDNADAREAAMEVALAEVRIDLLLAIKQAFAGEAVTIPRAVKRPGGSVISVYEQDLSEALSDVWGDTKVEALFMAMQSAPVEQLAAARAAFQTASALAYIAGQGDALAEHRVNFPEQYDGVTQ